MAKKFFSTEKRLGGIFFCIYIPLGFANCQPFLYISNVRERHGTHNYSNEYDFWGLLMVNRIRILKA